MTDDRLAELSQLLVAEQSRYEELMALLLEEQKALVGGQAMLLDKLAAQKLSLLSLLERMGDQCGEMLRLAGIAGGRAGLYRWLADKPEFLAQWQRLELVAEKAKAVNDLNGKLIAERLKGVTEALSALMHSDQSTVAYGRKGGAQSVLSGGRSFGAA